MGIACGASALGFVSAMPSGPGVISEETIAHIARRIPSPIATFLLTSAASSDAIIAQQHRCGTNTLQLCDYVNTSVYSDLRCELPGVALVQVIHVTGSEAVALARAATEHVHALLLDSGDTTSAVKLLGGTRRTHDWTTSRRIRDTVGVPVFLAGDLTATNVGEAVATVEPFGVDLCSGVRTDDRLDLAKLQGFFSALHESVER
jgi:phosphoribosylanthranilate isomerase